MNTRGFVFRNVGSKCIALLWIKNPIALLIHLQRKVHIQLTKKKYYRFYENRYCFVCISFCLWYSRNSVSQAKQKHCWMSLEKERKRDKTYVTVLYFLLHSFPIFLYKKKGGQFSKLVSLTPLLLYSRKWSLMTCWRFSAKQPSRKWDYRWVFGYTVVILYPTSSMPLRLHLQENH